MMLLRERGRKIYIIVASYHAMMHVNVKTSESSQRAEPPLQQKSNGGMKWAEALHARGHRGSDQASSADADAAC